MSESTARATDHEKRQKAMQANREAMQMLFDAYPSIFSLEQAKPLKIGIHEDLAADGKLSKTKIRKALATYVRQIAYYQCLTEGASRVNLQGEATAEVTADDAKHATERLEQIDSKRKERQNQRKKHKVKQQRISSKLSELVNKTNQRTN